MIDQAEIRKHRIAATVTSKTFWIPTLLGLAIGSLSQPPVAWLGWAAVGIGVASVVWKLTIGSQRLTERVVAKLKRRSSREHGAYLRQLQRKLRQDRDPRTGDMLRKLRDIYHRTEAFSTDSAAQTAWIGDLLKQVKDLYESSLSALERSFELWAKSRGMSTDESRQQVLDWRNDVLKEVEGSIQQLGKSVDQLQALTLKRELPDDELSRVRSELEQGLIVARSTEERIANLEYELSGESRPVRDSS